MIEKKCPRCKQMFPKAYFTRFNTKVCLACQFKEIDEKAKKQ